jgi:teichuronic acid biosynthesis glycosyltransferase TuaC
VIAPAVTAQMHPPLLDGRRLRVLVITRLFPNSVEPLSAPFNRQQFAALHALCDVDVLATIPTFPGARLLSRWTAAGRLGEVPRREVIDGLAVSHPRYLHVPVVARPAAAALYAASIAKSVLTMPRRYDVLLGSWAFPDGVATVMLAKLMGIPVAIKVHGSDINVAAKFPSVAINVRWALRRCDRVIAVSRALADSVAALGVPTRRIDVIRNGVDATLFRPRDRADSRGKLGFPGDERPWLLYVGRVEERKGVLELLDAFSALARSRPDVQLVVVGDGSLKQRIAEAIRGPLRGRILWAGSRPLAEVPHWMAACNALVLPSWSEGTPNVVLEALACGRRVVATAVGGIPDVITGPEFGELVAPRSPRLLEAALARALSASASSDGVAAPAITGSWGESAALLERSLRAAVRVPAAP